MSNVPVLRFFILTSNVLFFRLGIIEPSSGLMPGLCPSPLLEVSTAWDIERSKTCHHQLSASWFTLDQSSCAQFSISHLARFAFVTSYMPPPKSSCSQSAQQNHM